MAIQTANTAVCQCSFGAAPASLPVPPACKVLACGLPAATVMDNKLPPFGMCSSLANPAVSSATTAAGGVLTPQPCSPVLTAPWMPGSLTVQIGGKSALNNTSKLMCAYGGVIQVVSPMATTVVIP